MKGADIMRDVDAKDTAIRREAFLAVSQFAGAVTDLREAIEWERYWSDADAERVVTAAQAAVMYLADGLRSPIDRALGVVDLAGELAEATGARFAPNRGELARVAAVEIVRVTVGLPPPRDWPTCAVPGCTTKDSSVTSTIAGITGPVCDKHWLEDYNRRKAAEKAPEPEPTRACAPSRAAHLDLDLDTYQAPEKEVPL